MKVENPLSGWPATEAIKGGAGFRINAKYLTPVRMMLTDCVFLILCFGLTISFFAAMLGELGFDPRGHLLQIIVLWFVGYSALIILRKPLGRQIFGKTAVIEFQPDLLRIKGLAGFKNYDRRLPHEFTVEIHEAAEWEEKLDITAQRKAQMEGKKKLPTHARYFRDSFLIILRYAGQRVDIASVYGKKSAEALLVRLQLLDQIMDAARGEVGGERVAEPEKQYGARPEAG